MAKKSDTPGNITLRLDGKTKFTLELLSRSQHRSITAVVGWLAQEEAKRGLLTADGESMVDRLWSVNEWERILRLSVVAPELMNFREEEILNVIKTEPRLWTSEQDAWLKLIGRTDVQFEKGAMFPNLMFIGMAWDMIVDVADGGPKDDLEEFLDVL